MCHGYWPKPPIWAEDLPLIRELLTNEEYAELLKRMVQVLPNGPLLDYKQGLESRARTESPERRWDARGFMSLARVVARLVYNDGST